MASHSLRRAKSFEFDVFSEVISSTESRRLVKVYLIEFKSDKLPGKLSPQLLEIWLAVVQTVR